MQYVHNHLKNNNDILPVGKKRKSLNFLFQVARLSRSFKTRNLDFLFFLTGNN